MLLQLHAGGRTKFAAVRFGNVLGSRGSFLAVLADQIARGEAVTVTHPDVTRFFMTVEEAVGLVIEALNLARSGETFVLDMGMPVRIVDLVQNYATQLHMDTEDFTIRYTGLRPGEKLEEALFSETEERIETAHPLIWATQPTSIAPDFADRLQDLYRVAGENRPNREICEFIHRLLPEYSQPQGDTLVAMGAPYPDDF
jgi:FlaA1/EpsC-like NDP-sugar epimerase